MFKKFVPIVAALLLASLFGVYWYFNYFNNNAALATGQKVQFTVTQGMTTSEIATMLHKLRLINTPESFRLAAKFRGLDR